ncbi:cinnamoyl-CoA reductase 1-like [Rhodamnia argentea]|uniref:Cinnamoyl-CoA reductase 1-like n=1 Tax=Rhodamnia argentea TaxID=178133 RepID=A0ABM3GZ24_9MYRT|nr:cinnamoyl-CoA reductase 1-like [Rhodamnia argentea]
MAEKTLCVTGAGGFLASWVVKILLSKGYTVHGTVRDPSDAKNAHLKELDKASEKLRLFKADLLDYDSLRSAIEGCCGVLHVASPVPPSSVSNPEVQLLAPAVKGTLNVLKACSEAKVKRVVYVSSVAALMMIPSWPNGQAMDESSWSDKEYCRRTENWYCLSKTEAESEALEYANRNGLDVVSVCPSYIFGPILQPTLNASTMVLLNVMKGGQESVPNRFRNIVDVRDVAAAVILAYEKPEAEGRYICTSYCIKTQDLVEKVKTLYPNYNYPKSFTETEEWVNISSEKLRGLGWTYRALEETLVDSVESYGASGLLETK